MEGGTLESAESTFPPLKRLHHSRSTELHTTALDEDTRMVVAETEIVGEEPAVLPRPQQTSERDAAPPSADSGREGLDPAITPGQGSHSHSMRPRTRVAASRQELTQKRITTTITAATPTRSDTTNTGLTTLYRASTRRVVSLPYRST